MVNTGKSVLEFVQHVRKIDANLKIVLVAGVVQDQCIAGAKLGGLLADCPDLHLIALRTSRNKYTGTKGVDTGNRLFNTTYLD